jgi:glycosyltransferase involved in cell wall biosynthesis
MKRTILFFVNDVAFFISHRLPLARHAVRNGWHVHVAGPASAASERLLQEGVTYHSVSLNRKSLSLSFEIQTFVETYSLFRSIKPDVLHNVTIKPVIYGGLVARYLGIPCVINAITGLGFAFLAEGLKWDILRGMIRTAYRCAMNHANSLTIFQNPDDQDEFVKGELVSPARALLIKGSGVDMNAFFPSPEPILPHVVVAAARMLYDKGIEEFVEAARILKKKGFKARFVLVGEPDPGNLSSIPTEKLAAWHEQGDIEWWGRQDNMPQVFARSHIVCLPSYREGTPKVLIEAAASGRPIVASDVPGCREVVKHGENGLLVPVKNAAELAKAVLVLLKNPALRQKMGKKGRAMVENELSEEVVVRSTFRAYDTLLKNVGLTVAPAFSPAESASYEAVQEIACRASAGKGS